MLTEVSVQDDIERTTVDTQASLQLVKGPCDDAPTGEAGLPADAIIQWGKIESGKQIKDFTITREEYIKHTLEGSALQLNVDPGWLKEEDIREVRHESCPENRVWASFSADIPPNGELCISRGQRCAK